MEAKVQGIVLSSIDYKDHDQIIHVMSTEGESFTFYARGVNKLNSKNSGGCLPFSLSNFIYFESSKSMKQLKTAEIIKNYSFNFNDYDSILLASAALEISQKLHSLQSYNPQVFTLLIFLLENMKKENKELMMAYFLKTILQVEGINLQASCCSRCQSTTIHSISIQGGGFICRDCTDELLEYNITVLQLFHALNSRRQEEILDIIVNEEDAKSILKVFFAFFVEYSGLYSPTLQEYMTKNIL